MKDDVAPTSRTWEAFAESPATLFQPQHHPARLLRQREQHGRLHRNAASPMAAYYTPGFTPFEMRHQLGFATRSYDCVGPSPPLRHQGCVNAACWSEDGQVLYTAGDDRLVQSWDTTRGFKHMESFNTLHEGNIFGVQVAPGRPELLLTCSADGTLRRHDIGGDLSSRGRERLVGTCAPHAVMHGFCFWDGGGGSGGQVVLTAQGNGIVMKYDLREPSSAGQAIYHRRSPGGWYLSVKDVVTPDLHNTATGISPFMMCLGGQGPTLEVHDLRRLPSTTAKPLQTYRPQGLPETLHQTRLGMEEEVSVSGLAYSKTRREILVSYQGDQIYGFNTADAAACGEEGETHESWSLGGHVNSKTFLKSVTYFGPREEYIACGDDLAHTWIWDRRTGMLVNLVCTDMSVANGCVPHPFLPMLACWGIDDMVKVLTVGGRFSSIKEEESVDKALEEEEEGGAAAGAGARQESGRERPRRGRGGREERGGGRRRAPRWTVKGLQLLPSQYVGTILEIGMVSRVFSNPEKPRMVYDHERYRQHVRRIRQFLAQPGDRLPDYPTDSSDSYTLAELESMLLEVKERGNVFFKAKQYRRAARSYKKIEIWLFSMAEMRRKVDKARLEASALGDSDHYERWLGDPAGSSLVPPVQQPSRRQAVVAKDVTGTTGKGGGEAKNGTHEEEQDAVLTRLVDLLVTSNLNLAMTVQAQGQHLHAIALCTSVLRIKPREAKAFYRRGVAALELGEDFEAAVKDLARARDLAPGDALIARKLAEGRRLLKAQLARESRAYAAFFLSSAPDEEEGATGGAAGQG